VNIPYYVLLDAIHRIAFDLHLHEGGADGKRAIAYSAFEMYLRDLEAINHEKNAGNSVVKEKLETIRKHAGRLCDLFPEQTITWAGEKKDDIDYEKEYETVSVLATELRGESYWTK
jgi:hypothetical protein